MWPKEGCTPVLGAKLVSLLVVFRVLNSLLVRTSFTPDEFWQGPEPAHLLAFGKGHLTWEWEPSARIRGFTHPLIFAGIYKALEMVGLDTRWAVAHSPKLLQGVMAGVCDYCAFGLALRAFGAAAAGWALLFQVLSWFNFYCLVRPYSNSAEAVLATAALFYWVPLFLSSGRGGSGSGGGGGTRDRTVKGGGGEGARRASQETLALLLAALCVAVRPTSAALWTLVGLLRLSTLPPKHWPRYLTLTVLPPVGAVVGASFILDSWFYGAATFVPLNFLRFNVLEGKSRIFGEQAWHWNFSQGLPAVLGAALPAALWGFWRPRGGGGGGGARGLPGCGGGGGGDRLLGWLAVWFLVYHSTSPHKEFRFLLPVLPIAHAYAGQAVSAFLAAKFSGKKNEEPTETLGDFASTSQGGVKDKSGDSSQDNASVVGATKGTVKPLSRGGGGGGGGGSGGSGSSSSSDGRGRWRRAITTTLFLLHAPAAVYLSVWHQSGALSAVDVVANRVPALALAKMGTGGSDLKREGKGAVVAVHFLMPCHSAPLHSHLHFRDLETSLWSLDCSPKNRELPGGSESDKFQSDPLAFVQSTYDTVVEKETEDDGRSLKLPDLAVIYSTHLDRPGVADYLDGLGLEVVQVVFNAHVNGDADSDDTHRSVAVLERVACRGEEGGVGSPRSCSF